MLLEYSSRVWGYLELNPAWGSQTGFEALLMIKRACIAGCVVPARYTHVLIDESQDIPGSRKPDPQCPAASRNCWYS